MSSLLRLPVLEYPVASESWREWRRFVANHLLSCSASMITGYFGHNYVSYKQTLIQHMCDPVPTGEWQMADAAKKHGTDNEEAAKRAFIDTMREYSPRVLEDGQHTKLSLLYDMNVKKTAFMMTTPDMILNLTYPTRPATPIKTVVEFKCPYFELFTPSLRNNRSVTLVASDFWYKHQFGRENSFLQALTYAITEGVNDFYTCYYFTDTVNEAMVVYRYTIRNEEFFGDIYEAALDIKEHLTKEPGDIRVRSTTVNKRRATRIMKLYWVAYDILEYKEDGEWHSLCDDSSDEEPSDDSEGDGPHVPGKPS